MNSQWYVCFLLSSSLYHRQRCLPHARAHTHIKEQEKGRIEKWGSKETNSDSLRKKVVERKREIERGNGQKNMEQERENEREAEFVIWTLAE